jgi:hypothetical protein
MPMTRAGPLRAAIVLLLMAGCSGGGDWAKPGADDSAAAAAYQDCRGLADTAVGTDRAIDQDILASRQSDWDRAAVVRQQTQVMHEHTRDRAAAIVDSCMKGKGFRAKP